MTPNARALYWYLMATHSEQTVSQIVTASGIPESSVYQACQKFPDVFTLTGSVIRPLHPPTIPTAAMPE